MEQYFEEYELEPDMEAILRHGGTRRKTEAEKAFGIANPYAVRAVENYLLNYDTYQKMICMNRYEKAYFAAIHSRATEIAEEKEEYLRAKLYEIRAFILSLPDCNEKLFLYYYYVHGESIMRCAEMLYVSRATAYRLKKSALHTAAYYYHLYENAEVGS